MARTPAPDLEGKLLLAAQQCLLERGFDAKVSEIADRAGVAKGTFYLHFFDKEQCCRRAIDAFLALLSEGLRMSPLGQHLDPGAHYDALLAQNEKVLIFCSRNRKVLRLLFGRTGGRAYADLRNDAAERALSLFETMARELTAQQIYRPHEHPELVVRFIAGGYKRLVQQMIERPETPDLAALARTALEIVTIGLLKRGGGASLGGAG